MGQGTLKSLCELSKGIGIIFIHIGALGKLSEFGDIFVEFPIFHSMSQKFLMSSVGVRIVGERFFELAFDHLPTIIPERG